MKIVVLLLLGAFYFVVSPSLASQKGQSLAIEKGCTSCHGVQGVSDDRTIPNLAGQKIKYLFRQMKHFRNSDAQTYQNEKVAERYHPEMGDESVHLTHTQSYLILQYYSNLSCGVKPKKITRDILPQAKRCEVCHGGMRSNPFKDSPNLNGQKKDYMIKQISLMKAATENPYEKNTRFHRLTELMIEGLTDKDIGLVADYYSNLGCNVP